MAEIKTVMTEFYNILYKLRYSKITEVEPESIASIVFTGENRIHLLSWLLTEKIPQIAMVLGKLEGAALEDELAKYYSQLGIYINKNILLGECSLEEQLPMLNLLLEFIKNVYVDTSDIPSSGAEPIENLLTELFTENTSNLDNAISKGNTRVTNSSRKPKKLTESKQNKTSFMEELPSDDIKHNNTENKENFTLELDKFINVYESVSSWPVDDMKIKNNIENNMNTYVKNISSDFMVLKQMLHIKSEIPKLVIPQEPLERYTPLNSIIEDMVTSIDNDFSKI